MPSQPLTNSATFGGNPYAQPWDDLPLPGGQKIGDQEHHLRTIPRITCQDWSLNRRPGDYRVSGKTQGLDMLRIDKFKDGRWRSIDLHDLPVGETWAHKLTGADLFRELNRLGVKDINSSMGWQDLALAWGNILADRKEASQA